MRVNIHCYRNNLVKRLKNQLCNECLVRSKCLKFIPTIITRTYVIKVERKKGGVFTTKTACRNLLKQIILLKPFLGQDTEIEVSYTSNDERNTIQNHFFKGSK